MRNTQLLQSNVQGISIRDELRDLQRQESGFLMIIEGFMGLGLRLAQKLVQDPDQGFSQDAGFILPWTTILPIITLTILVALLMTWIPAQQTGRIAPAEALRYE